MFTERNKSRYGIAAISLVTLLSRLPFLNAGFGTDPDAWRVANAAKAMVDSGGYIMSRPPGNPLHEIASALLFKGGPWFLNGATALMSVVAVVFFVLSLRRMKIPNHFMAGLMLAFVPIVYISSTATIDYVWALAFVMVSLYAVVGRSYLWGGLFLGLAIGCRITSGAMIIPFGIIISQNRSSFFLRYWVRDNFRFCAAAAAAAVVVFLPVFLKYGTNLLTFYDVESQPLSMVLRKMFFEVWGIGGTYAFCGIVAVALIVPPVLCRINDPQKAEWRRFIRPSVIVVLLYLIAYLRLPCEAGYLIPMLPFAILIFAGCMKRWVMVVATIAVALTSFVDLECPTCAPNLRTGPFLVQHEERVKGVEFVNRIFEMEKDLPEKAVIVVAWWEPYIRLLRKGDAPGDHHFIYCLDQARLNEWTGKGYAYYHLPSVEDYNLKNYGVDLRQLSTAWEIPY